MNLNDAHRGYLDSFYKDGEILLMENSSNYYIANFFTYDEINKTI